MNTKSPEMVGIRRYLSCLPRSFRINIREQLAASVLLAVICALIVISFPIWTYVNGFVKDIESDRLALTASLKATRISAELDSMYMNIQSLGSRILVQSSLQFYYQNTTNWAPANESLQAALSAPGLNNILQCRVYTRNDTGNPHGVLNVTGNDIPKIPLNSENATAETIYVSDTPEGYPASLYPTLTYRDTGVPDPADPTVNATDVYAFDTFRMNGERGLLLGPLTINGTFALFSLTIPIYQSTSSERFVLGYLTVVSKATSIFSATTSREGLGETGIVLVIGPTNPTNRFNMTMSASTDQFKVSKSRIGSYMVHFLLPPTPLTGQRDRHPQRSPAYTADDMNAYFNVSQYPAVMESYSEQFNTVNNASSLLKTTNEEGYKVAVGFARTNTSLANWTVLVEQARSEAFEPVVKLRNIMLITVFSTVGVIMIIVIPCAHIGVMPIRRLRDATQRTIPGGYDEWEKKQLATHDVETPPTPKKGSFVNRALVYLGFRSPPLTGSLNDASGNFMIPEQVPTRYHFIEDELTELTTTFNDMAEELNKQYRFLDTKVESRTRELEISRKAAEAANESKTLFMANLSHELKTPLNGVVGIADLCLESRDPQMALNGMRIVQKSADLLLYLISDLLSFSRNQFGSHININKSPFPLSDIYDQMTHIFIGSAESKNINLDVDWKDSTIDGKDVPGRAGPKPGAGPDGCCNLEDMWLWGDCYRIIQITNNLITNALKFCPSNSTVKVRMWINEGEEPEGEDGVPFAETVLPDPVDQKIPEDDSTAQSSSVSSSDGSVPSRHASKRTFTSKPGINKVISNVPNTKSRNVSDGTAVVGTALSVNPMNVSEGYSPFLVKRETKPPKMPCHGKMYNFKFSVEDTGPGIVSHMLANIFEPFVQADLGLNRGHNGTGLGLSIAQQLATLMGGRIRVTSQIDRGSIFTLTVPLAYLGQRPSYAERIVYEQRMRELATTDIFRSVVFEQKVEPTVDFPDPPTMLDGGLVHNKSRDSGVVSVSIAQSLEEEKKSLSDKSMADDKSASSSKSETPTTSTERAVPKFKKLKLKNSSKTLGKSAKLLPNMVVDPEDLEKLGKMRILVADDNNTNLDVICQILRTIKVSIIRVARNGQQAFDVVKEIMDEGLNLDMIFMDIQMPVLNGLEATKKIREIGCTAPVIALSAFSDDGNVQECLNAGMDAFITKPASIPRMRTVVHKFGGLKPIPKADTPMPRPEMKVNTASSSDSSDVSSTIANGVPTPPPDGSTGDQNELELNTDLPNISVPHADMALTPRSL